MHRWVRNHPDENGRSALIFLSELNGKGGGSDGGNGSGSSQKSGGATGNDTVSDAKQNSVAERDSKQVAGDSSEAAAGADAGRDSSGGLVGETAVERSFFLRSNNSRPLFEEYYLG